MQAMLKQWQHVGAAEAALVLLGGSSSHLLSLKPRQYCHQEMTCGNGGGCNRRCTFSQCCHSYRGVSNNYHTVSPSFDFDVWSLQLPQRLPELGLSKGAGGQGCEGGAPGVEEGVRRRKEVQGPSPRTPSCDTPTKRLMMAEF